LATLGGVFAASVFSSVLVMVLVAVFPRLQADLSNRLRFVSAVTDIDLLGAVTLLVAVAIHEEVLFRGLFIPYLRRLGCGWFGALAISAGVFGGLHYSQGFLAIPQIFCVGLTLGAFYMWSRSLTAVMLAHFLYDLTMFQLAPVVLRWAEQAQHQI
jgi:membrane protease YdiL (CAAX protease family)